jgi:hypothetical protein
VAAGGTTSGINFALSLATGTITGVVTNKAGAAVAGANVSVLVAGTVISATGPTDATGAFTITNVPAGTGYAVTVTKAGYADGTTTGVSVTAGGTTAGVALTLNVSYAAWAATVFTAAQLADPSVSGSAADPDQDGIPNLLEYAFNLNPLAADRTGLPVVGTIAADGGLYLTITYTQLILSGDLAYTVEASTDMVAWSTITPVPVSSTTSGSAQTVTVHDPVALAAGSSRFLRVVVTGP